MPVLLLLEQSESVVRNITFWDLMLAMLGSSVVAALITLVGVWRQNLSNERRQREQIDAIAEQKERDRLAQVKRDIYIELAEGLARMQIQLGRFVDPTAKQKDHSDNSLVMAVALNKLSLVATIEMIEVVHRLSNYYTKQSTNLIAMQTGYTLANAHIDALRDEADALRAEIDGKGNIIEEKIVTLGSGAPELTPLIDEHTSLVDRYEKLRGDLKTAHHERGQLSIEVGNAAIKASLGFEKHLNDLQYLARLELGFPIERDKFKALNDALVVRQEELADEVAQGWKRRFDDYLGEISG